MRVLMLMLALACDGPLMLDPVPLDGDNRLRAVYSREWCEQWAATDGELEWCAETYPDLYPPDCDYRFPADDADDRALCPDPV